MFSLFFVSSKMRLTIGNVTKAVQDCTRRWRQLNDQVIYPKNHCSICQKISRINHSEELRKNIATLGIQDQSIRDISWICGECFKNETKTIDDTMRPWCQLCGKREFKHSHCSICHKTSKTNHVKELRNNMASFSPKEPISCDIAWVCSECLKDESYTKCSKTGHVFKAKLDRRFAYQNSKYCSELFPYHLDSHLKGPLSPEGFLFIELEHTSFVERHGNNWAGGTKTEDLRGHRIVRQLRTVKCEIHCLNAGRVEEILRWYSAQAGGNGFIRLFLDQHLQHKDEKYVAGYRKNGNPCHRTRRTTTRYYTGYAVAVIAEEVKGESSSHKL